MFNDVAEDKLDFELQNDEFDSEDSGSGTDENNEKFADEELEKE